MSRPASRPFVHINVAVKADGRMGEGGKPLTISCDADWRRVHGLRESYDAVAVGATTWIADEPRLTVRQDVLGRRPRRQPARVIFAGRRSCRVPDAERRTFVIGQRRPVGGDVVHIRCSGREVAAVLSCLRQHGIGSLLVEGGPTLVRSFLAQEAFDHFTAYVSTADALSARRAVRGLFAGLPRTTASTLGLGTLLSWGNGAGAGA